ncbi:MAG: hypothetical protein KJN85_06080 [Maribacter sp.]|nr:hypothetical protein [Maribacter sp.]MBT8314113.1 hypothetical protein [Maribacter sp.]NNK18472.1 hypothetical protein [Maribacter sp.]
MVNRKINDLFLALGRRFISLRKIRAILLVFLSVQVISSSSSKNNASTNKDIDKDLAAKNKGQIAPLD